MLPVPTVGSRPAPSDGSRIVRVPPGCGGSVVALVVAEPVCASPATVIPGAVLFVSTDVVFVVFDAAADFAVVCELEAATVVDDPVGTAVVPVSPVTSDVEVSRTDDVEVEAVELVPDVFFPPPHAASPTASRTVTAATCRPWWRFLPGFIRPP
jgi:hypothetical protein